MSAHDLPPEEQAERVRMALAEAGYPDAIVDVDEHPLMPGFVGVSVDQWTPVEATWRAFLAAGLMGTCWPCYSAGRKERGFGGTDGRCTHDPLTSPQPEVVR